MGVSWIPRIGQEFAGYRLDSLLGHGGMSIVYRAVHLNLERTVALKLLAPELSEDEAFRERFTRESRLAAGLDHPNVIPIYEAGDEDGVFYIAMRYVDGSNLKALIQNDGPLDAQRTVSIITQAAGALDAAHENKGLVHRDVKPANILIVARRSPDDVDHVYLSDFGIAKQRSSRVLTKTGMFVGTADYAAPEQIEGKELDRRADVYALGCVLYECLTGNPAYEKDSEVALMYAHLLEPPPTVSGLRPDLPPEIDTVLSKAMAKNRDERYATMREFATGLREALSPDRVREATSAHATASPETVLAAPPPAAPAPAAAAAAGRPATAEQPPTAPPTAPPAELVGRGDGWRSRKGLIGLGALAALAIVGAVVAVVLLTGGESKTSSGTTNGTQTPATMLAALVPTGISTACTTNAKPNKGAIETDSCTPPASAPTAYPDNFTLSFYNSAAARSAAYDEAKSKITVGSCGGVPGEKTWIHVATGKRGGVRVCGTDKATGDSTIVWTHEKLGSPDHVDMVGVALEPGRSPNLFRSWWNAINDDVGKCRPKLPEDTCFSAVKKFEKKTPAT